MRLRGSTAAASVAALFLSTMSQSPSAAAQAADGPKNNADTPGPVQPLAGPVPKNNLKPGVTRSRGISIDVDRLADALKRGAQTSASLDNWVSGQVKIIDLSQFDENARTKLETVLRENGPAANDIRAAIARNELLAAELERSEVPLTSVVGAGVQSDGTVIVYMR